MTTEEAEAAQLISVPVEALYALRDLAVAAGATARTAEDILRRLDTMETATRPVLDAYQLELQERARAERQASARVLAELRVATKAEEAAEAEAGAARARLMAAVWKYLVPVLTAALASFGTWFASGGAP